MRVLVIDAVHHGGLEHGVGANFQRAQSRSRVGGEDGVAGSSAKHHDPARFQFRDGLVAAEGIGHLRHGGAGHNHGGHPLLAQSVLDGNGVHDGGQHTDLIGVHAVHFAGGAAAPEIAAAHHNADLNPQIMGGLDAGAD